MKYILSLIIVFMLTSVGQAQVCHNCQGFIQPMRVVSTNTVPVTEMHEREVTEYVPVTKKIQVPVTKYVTTTVTEAASNCCVQTTQAFRWDCALKAAQDGIASYRACAGVTGRVGLLERWRATRLFRRGMRGS